MNTKETQTDGLPWAYTLGRGANPRFNIQDSAGGQIASTPELVRDSRAHADNARKEANAALIVTAVNEHATLCRVAEAARELGAKLEEYAQGSGTKRKSDWAMEMLAARDALDASLAALDTLRASPAGKGGV